MYDTYCLYVRNGNVDTRRFNINLDYPNRYDYSVKHFDCLYYSNFYYRIKSRYMNF